MPSGCPYKAIRLQWNMLAHFVNANFAFVMYFIMSRERARGGIMPYVINMCRIFTISEIPQTSPNCYAFVFAAIAMTFCCWALRCQAQRSHNTGWHVPIVCSHEWWETQHPCSSELDRGRQNIAIRPVLSRTNLSKKDTVNTRRLFVRPVTHEKHLSKKILYYKFQSVPCT